MNICKLMIQLYSEDPGPKAMSMQKAMATLMHLSQKPDLGKVVVMEEGIEIIGYAILVNFWSNEYGGVVIHIDELFVTVPYRSKGIGTGFVQYVIATKMEEVVCLQLEVTPDNQRAKKLYQRLGFKMKSNLAYELEL